MPLAQAPGAIQQARRNAGTTAKYHYAQVKVRVLIGLFDCNFPQYGCTMSSHTISECKGAYLIGEHISCHFPLQGCIMSSHRVGTGWINAIS